jgi:hypothetical protein
VHLLLFKELCESYLTTDPGAITIENFCRLHEIASLLDSEELKHGVLAFILAHREDVKNSEEWNELLDNSPRLSRDLLLELF